MKALWLLLSTASCLVSGHPLADIHAVCERFTQCRTLATLDERLCVGNSRTMPFWLAPRNPDDVVAQRCHETMKPHYRKLASLEEEATAQMLACLVEQATPVNAERRGECQRDLVRSPRFSEVGEPGQRVPTNCFQGISHRIERQCGSLRACCTSYASCSSVEEGELAGKIKELKEFIRDFGYKCQLGFDLKELAESKDEDLLTEHQPDGNITITVRTKDEPAHDAGGHAEGKVVVRVLTAAEEIARLRAAGETRAADRLQAEIDKRYPGGSGRGSESDLGSAAHFPLVPSHSSKTTKTTDDSLWSTPDPMQREHTLLEPARSPVRLVTGVPFGDEHSNPTAPSAKPHPPARTPVKAKTNSNSRSDDEDLLKKYSHVKTLNKLVEYYRQQEQLIEASAQNDDRPRVEPVKLRQFFDRWEQAMRKKYSPSEAVADPEAAAEFERLMKMVEKLRKLIHSTN